MYIYVQLIFHKIAMAIQDGKESFQEMLLEN